MIQEIFRQGDVILERVSRKPLFCFRTGNEFSVSGETGQLHTMQAQVYKPITKLGAVIVRVADEGGALMTHPEHPPLNIPRGTYISRKVRSYEPTINKPQPNNRRNIFDALD